MVGILRKEINRTISKYHIVFYIYNYIFSLRAMMMMTVAKKYIHIIKRVYMGSVRLRSFVAG